MSSSSDVVNYSLRQNKSIERSLVFDGARTLIDRLGLTDFVYVGLGSVWFADFHLAHRHLRTGTMVSIEADPVTYTRAVFNKPYRTVDVRPGLSSAVIPGLLKEPELQGRPWMVWLDYDQSVGEDELVELADLVGGLPPDSLLLTTFSATAGRYGNKPVSRPQRLRDLFGAAAPPASPGGQEDDLSLYSSEALPGVLAESMQRHLRSKALQKGRPGGYLPAFQLIYRDGTPMVTVGGFLASPGRQAAAAAVVADADWACLVRRTIDTPLLTQKETQKLQEQLPVATGRLTRAQVNRLGFDLEQDALDSFQDHYLRFPTFSQLMR